MKWKYDRSYPARSAKLWDCQREGKKPEGERPRVWQTIVDSKADGRG